MSKFEIFFAKLFNKLILSNNIIKNILVTLKNQMVEYKTKIDNTLNEDI